MKWKTPIRRILLLLASLILILPIGGYIVIHTAAFHRFVIRKIIETTQESTGEQLTIGKLAIDWGQLKVDVYGLILRKPSMHAPPFLTCDHLGVGVKVLSWWRHKIALSELVLDRPVVRVLVTSQGQTNLPHSNAPLQESSSDKLFDLAVGHFELNSGELDYNDQEIPLSADLRDLRAQVHFNLAAQTYQGSLAYDRARIAAEKLTPFEHAAQLDFVANRSTLSINSLALSTGDTRFTAKGTLTDYSSPRLQASYQALLFTPDLARVLNAPSIPTGHVQTWGSLQYASSDNGPFLNSVHVEGRVYAPALDVRVGELLARVQRARANYTLDSGNISVREIVADALGGSAHGNFTMTHLGARPSASLSASVRGASLAELTRVVPSRDRQGATFAGRTNADVQAAWTGPITNVVTHIRATISGPLTPAVRHTIPVNGFVDVLYNGARATAAFAPSTLRTANTQISFNGTLSDHASLTVQASARDLSEIAQLVSSLEPANTNSNSNSLTSLDLRGSANFAGQMQGSPSAPRIRGHVRGNNVAIKGTVLPRIQADLDLAGSGISIQNAILSVQEKGQLKFSAQVDLRDWSFTPLSPVWFEASASGIALADLQRIAKLPYPVAGNLTANISLHGSENNPAGQASIDISHASAWGESIERLAIRLQGDGNSIRAKAQLEIPAGAVSTEFSYSPKSQQYDARLDAPKLDITKIRLPRSRGFTVAGAAAISATGKGTIREPQLSAHLEIPQLQIEDQTISQVKAQLNFVNQHANFTLNSIVVGGYAQAKGDIDLRGTYPATASLDVRALPIGGLLASYLPQVSNTLHGQTELHATLTGPLKQPEEIKAQVQIPMLDLAYQSVRIGLADPMRFDYANGVLSIASADIKGTGTDLSVRGTVPLKSTQPLNVSANGTIDLGLIQSFSPSVKSSGQIKIQIAARGGISAPTMQGQVRVENALFSSETFPIALEGINGQIRVAGNRLDIDQLNGLAGGGNLSASGFLIYGKQTSFHVSAQAKSVRLRYPEGLRTILDGNLDLSGTPDTSSLTGKVLVDRLSFTQQFDMATLIGEFSSDIPSTAPPLFEQNMKLNVAVATTSELNATSSKLTVGGSADLTVGGTLADPVILGRIVLTQGEVFFLGKRYEVQSGTIEFANPVRTDPVLNIYAKTTVEQYNITLNFVGPLDRLRTNYTSDPPLSEADIIHLVAFGTTAEEAATSSTPASVGAESVLAQGVSSQVSSRLERVTGISQINIDPLVTNSTADPASQISIQERVSGSLLVTFSADVTSTQAQTVAVEYRAEKNMTISVLRDYNGGYALDVRIRKTF
jgi:translocation and assembly module TamB